MKTKLTERGYIVPDMSDYRAQSSSDHNRELARRRACYVALNLQVTMDHLPLTTEERMILNKAEQILTRRSEYEA